MRSPGRPEGGGEEGGKGSPRVCLRVDPEFDAAVDAIVAALPPRPRDVKAPRSRRSEAIRWAVMEAAARLK